MDHDELARHLADKGALGAVVGLERGATDLIVAEMLRQGWTVQEEENVHGVRIRYLRAPRS
jgi:hypothetical protein